ncbi:hypothetical protein TNCV_4009711 [Trichonephila clavipes]|nr:hypothetical protein TNCV_4009711 [Trichonephila clavipes]
MESFFKNDEGHNVTVNGDRYRAMITNFFIPELNNHDVQELWFQQDGATCHTVRATIDLLKDTFGDRLISRFGLNIHRAASPLIKSIENPFQRVLQNWGVTEPNRTVTCIVLRAVANGRRSTSPCHDGFLGSRSDAVD